MIPSCVGSNPTSPAIKNMSYDSLTIFTGKASLKLASSVAKHLSLPLGKANVGRFSDGEIMVELSRLPAMLSFIRKFDFAAVLADETWLRKVSEWEGHLLPWLTIKSFHRDQKAEAEIWLASR